MAYDKKKIYKDAIKLATEKRCFFIEQLISFMPITKPTFYDYFKVGSDEFNAIKDVLDKNKVEVKSAMYNKWFKSENATLQVALMKLIATDEEAHRLNGSKQEIRTTEIKPIFKGIDLRVKGNDSPEESS